MKTTYSTDSQSMKNNPSATITYSHQLLGCTLQHLSSPVGMICQHLFSVMSLFCQNPLWRELAALIWGQKSISVNNEGKWAAVPSSSPSTDLGSADCSALPLCSEEGQPCFVFGTSLVLSFCNAEIYRGKVRGGALLWLLEAFLPGQQQLNNRWGSLQRPCIRRMRCLQQWLEGPFITPTTRCQGESAVILKDSFPTKVAVRDLLAALMAWSMKQ